MQTKTNKDEKLLCITWFIALAFTILQIILMLNMDNQYRRSRRVRRSREDEVEWIIIDPEQQEKPVAITTKKAA